MSARGREIQLESVAVQIALAQRHALRDQDFNESLLGQPQLLESRHLGTDSDQRDGALIVNEAIEQSRLENGHGAASAAGQPQLANLEKRHFIGARHQDTLSESGEGLRTNGAPFSLS